MKIRNSKVFTKLFIMYSTIIFFILALLSIFIVFIINNNAASTFKFENQKIAENVSRFFNQQEETSKAISKILYSNSYELKDTTNFLNYDYETYLKMRLDNFMHNSGQNNDNMDSFIKGCFSYNSNVQNVIFYSSSNDEFTIYYDVGNYVKIQDAKRKLDAEGRISLPEEKIIKLLNNTLYSKDGNSYYTIRNLKDPNSFQDMGLLIIKYNLTSINNIIKNYKKYNNTVLILDDSGKAIYDSSNKYTNTIYPYFSSIKTTDSPIKLNKYCYVNSISNDSGEKVVSILPAVNIFYKTKWYVILYLILCVMLLIIAESITYSKIKNLSNRISSITTAMGKVQNGDFVSVIPVDKEEDEITIISMSFNKMCKELDEYIKKVYISEIKQKNAEMVAFQSQINPHFLYNTLESIRMKAVIEGNKEVSKMIYNLAFLFRSMIKGPSKITIEKEISYCKLYLELFEFRYKDKLNYVIEIDDDIKNNEIMKFTIQPIIENYLVHGIDLEAIDNLIKITGERFCDFIKIYIEDNGVGISEENLLKIKDSLNGGSSDSIGLKNVNDRLKYQYGNEYGIEVQNNEDRGSKVTITIPIKGVELNV